VTPTFQGEVQFRRYSDTSTQGAQIVLGLADRDELQAFVGKEGKRFMAVLVEIGDDETPVEPQKPKVGPLCSLAVQWCKSRDFLEWVRPTYDEWMGGDGSGWGDVNPDEVGGNEAYCRHFILARCDVESRKELDKSKEAADRFHNCIRRPYTEWLSRRKQA